MRKEITKEEYEEIIRLHREVEEMRIKKLEEMYNVKR